MKSKSGKRIARVLAAALLLPGMLVLQGSIPVQASAHITVDGDFSDWSGFTAVQADGSEYSVGKDDANLYVRYKGIWSNWLGEKMEVRTGGAETEIRLNYDNMEEQTQITPMAASTAPIEGAQGIAVNSEKYPNYGYAVSEWEISIPLAYFANTTIDTEITVAAAGQDIIAESVNDIQEQQPEEGTEDGTEEEKPDEGGSDSPSLDGSIAIDGYYDDWNGIPKTDITWWGDSQYTVHEGALFLDGSNLYAYFGMSKPSCRKMEKDYMELKVNGRIYKLFIRGIDENGNMMNHVKDQTNGIHTNYAVYIGDEHNPMYYTKLSEQAAYTVYMNHKGKRTAGDQLEFAMDMSVLSEVTGIEEDQMREISIYNPNIGEQWISMVGTPTYAAAFLLIGIPIVLVGYYKVSKKKKEGLK